MRQVLGIVVVIGAVGAASLRAQDPRDAQVVRAFTEFDAARRLELLMSALNPASGPPRGAWPVGVQLLAQTLIEEKQDALAATWLRWAVRLSPDLQPDTVQFLPKVVSAHRSARDFVMSSRGPADSVAATTWLWPKKGAAERVGRLQIGTSGVTVPVRVSVRAVGPMSAGGTVPLNPGSYDVPLNAGSYEISAAASGYDSVRVTREVLPGVTTLIEFRLRPPVALVAQAPEAPRPAPSAPPATPEKKKKKGGFPVLPVVGGVAAVGVAAALLVMPSSDAEPSDTGSITVKLP